MTDPAWVRLSSADAEMARAMPKSVTFTTPDDEMSTLPGLMSRCTTPLRWAKPSAAATSVATSAARWGWSVPSLRRMSARLRPSTYSITMK